MSRYSDKYIQAEVCGPPDMYRRADILPLMRGGVVIDIGAHKGYFTMLAATVAKRVLAYEPAPVNFAALRRNTARLRNVKVYNAAVDAIGGTRRLTLSASPARHTFYPSPDSLPTTTVKVRCTTLTDIMADIERVALLKLDCEGSEYEILLTSNLSRVSTIALEFHEPPERRAELIAYLQASGFEGETYADHMLGNLHLSMGLFRR